MFDLLFHHNIVIIKTIIWLILYYWCTRVLLLTIYKVEKISQEKTCYQKYTIEKNKYVSQDVVSIRIYIYVVHYKRIFFTNNELTNNYVIIVSLSANTITTMLTL